MVASQLRIVECMFPFLTGKVLTSPKPAQKSASVPGFPFLIGKVLTEGDIMLRTMVARSSFHSL